jgi:hypothetical protein
LPPKQATLIAAGVCLTWAYIVAVFLLGEQFFGFPVRYRFWWPIIALSFVGTYWLVQVAYRRQWLSHSHLKKIALVSVVAVLSFLAVDIGYTIVENLGRPTIITRSGLGLPCFNDNDLLPRRFYPTERNFRVYSPNWSDSGRVCGSPPVRGAASVREVREQLYSTDENGFRETTPLEQARIFALGDSFTFGHTTHQDKIWPEVLERLIARPVYNLGISETGPRSQLMLLEWLLQTKNRDREKWMLEAKGVEPEQWTLFKKDMEIDRLLWMIYEENDLEDSYETLHDPLPVVPQQRGYARAIQNTIVAHLLELPWVLKEESVINRLRTGNIKLASARHRPEAAIYRSAQFGQHYFYLPGIKRLGNSRDYVVNHPNRTILDQTFKDMRTLAESEGFDVTVLLAPSSGRLYGKSFDNFPPISEERHFINYVSGLAQSMGFETVDLYLLMQPYAQEELLYWRDDVHWNERGNQVVGELVAEHVFNR